MISGTAQSRAETGAITGRTADIFFSLHVKRETYRFHGVPMPKQDAPLAVEPLPDDPGLEIVDRIEQERCVVRTATPVEPTLAADRDFRFPVDDAVQFETAELSLPNVSGVLVRDDSGSIVAQVFQLESEALPPGSYDIELLTQFKTYLSVESSVEVISNATEFSLEFGGETTVELAARSNHDRPANRVQTTKDPVDMMRAIETFGSALKTTTPDRAFPSLRGHPPAIDLGNSLDVPASVEPPESGITIELPALRETVYPAAPLAYYLGANLEPGPSPRLLTDEGFEYSLDGPEGYERTVAQTLKQLFFLDCVVRTEGLYKVDLHERLEMERVLDLNFPDLYARPLEEQIPAYLDVPYEAISAYIPDWRLTVHVQPNPSTIEQLPYVVDDLAVVRTQSDVRASGPSTAPAVAGADHEKRFTRSASSSSDTADVDYVEPEATDSLEQAWIGEDIPVGASKLSLQAFQNRLDREPVDGDISITIVLNDSRMAEERDLVDRAYGDRENLPFDVSVFRDLTTAELREVLARESDFVHYIGHTEQDGFRCADGKLDAATLGSTGIDSFLLNACNSYEQGLHLIEAGAIGGIVTLNEVLNDGAVRIGETVARLLNAGFPLRAALTIARGESILGGQYIVVGDGGMTVTQSASRTPNLLEISRTGEEFELHVKTYATDEAGLGTIYIPHLRESEEYFLTSGETTNFHIPEDRLAEFLQLEDVPIRNNGELQWCSSIDVSDID